MSENKQAMKVWLVIFFQNRGKHKACIPYTLHYGVPKVNIIDNNLKFRNLQFLRFIAAFIVIFAHVELYEFSVQGVPGGFFHLGSFGVDIFFVLSGFIMVHVYSGLPRGKLVAASFFFMKRVARVTPLYVIFTLATILLSYLIGAINFEHNISLGQHYNLEKTNSQFIIDSLTFSRPDYQPLFAIGWTLQNEFWFYAIFTLCILVGMNIYAFFIAYAVCILVATSLGVNNKGLMGITLNPMMLEFVFGVLLYFLYQKTSDIQQKPFFAFFLILAAGFFLIASSDPYFVGALSVYVRPILWGGGALFIVFFFLAIENRFSPSHLFTFLGDASYSMYLAHWFALSLMPYFFWRINWFSGGSVTVYILAQVVIAMGFSVVVYLWVEKPINQSLSAKISNLFQKNGLLKRA